MSFVSLKLKKSIWAQSSFLHMGLFVWLFCCVPQAHAQQERIDIEGVWGDRRETATERVRETSDVDDASRNNQSSSVSQAGTGSTQPVFISPFLNVDMNQYGDGTHQIDLGYGSSATVEKRDGNVVKMVFSNAIIDMSLDKDINLNEMSGSGSLKQKLQGRDYKGEIKHQMPDGIGTSIDQKGKVSGKFSKGVVVEWSEINNSQMSFSGKIVDGKGQGFIERNLNGIKTSYIGDLKFDILQNLAIPHGAGIITDSRGKGYYAGPFFNGLPHGKNGTTANYNGITEFTGDFSMGVPIGPGSLHLSDINGQGIDGYISGQFQALQHPPFIVPVGYATIEYEDGNASDVYWNYQFNRFVFGQTKPQLTQAYFIVQLGDKFFGIREDRYKQLHQHFELLQRVEANLAIGNSLSNLETLTSLFKIAPNLNKYRSMSTRGLMAKRLADANRRMNNGELPADLINSSLNVMISDGAEIDKRIRDSIAQIIKTLSIAGDAQEREFWTQYHSLFIKRYP